MTRAGAITIGTLLILGCARHLQPPPAKIPASVSVVLPANRTGRPLLIEGASFLEKYALHTDRVTVEDVLAAEARTQLVRRGIAVTPPEAVDAATGGRAPRSAAEAAELIRAAHLPGGVLYFQINQWESDGTHPPYVIVGADAVLLDVETGAATWSAHRPPTPVPTPGAVTVATAYTITAQKTAEEMLSSWGAERPPS